MLSFTILLEMFNKDTYGKYFGKIFAKWAGGGGAKWV